MEWLFSSKLEVNPHGLPLTSISGAPLSEVYTTSVAGALSADSDPRCQTGDLRLKRAGGTPDMLPRRLSRPQMTEQLKAPTSAASYTTRTHQLGLLGTLMARSSKCAWRPPQPSHRGSTGGRDARTSAPKATSDSAGPRPSAEGKCGCALA